MSIAKRRGWQSSVTEGPAALELFTNRHTIVREFCGLVNAAEVSRRILFLHGTAGNGKSLLLRFLAQRCCVRLHPDDWEYVSTRPNEEFITHITSAGETKGEQVPCVVFDLRPSSNREPPGGPIALRQALSTIGIRCPRFDLAWLSYLVDRGQLTTEKLAGFPAEEVDLLAEIADALSQTAAGSIAKVVVGLIAKRSRQSRTERRLTRRINTDEVDAIRALLHSGELLEHLATLLADDINDAMRQSAAPPRIALLFDGHEAFQGVDTGLSIHGLGERDRWLRRLLTTLDLDHGVVVVVAGREPPQWGAMARVPLDVDDLDLRHVAELSDVDARDYLRRAAAYFDRPELHVPDMVSALLNFARIREGIHPLYLGLGTDIVLAGGQGSRQIRPEDLVTNLVDNKVNALLDRLFTSINSETVDAVRALSACRTFDQDLYLLLGRELSFLATGAGFDAVSRFSFVVPTQVGGRLVHRVHDLLRKVLHEQADDQVMNAHRVLEAYFRGKDSALGEAIYHANRLDPGRGVEEWCQALDDLTAADMTTAQSLLEVEADLVAATPGQAARIAHARADHLQMSSRHREAMSGYRQAIDGYERALQRDASNDVNQNNRALALMSLGESQIELAEYEEARDLLRRSAAAFEIVLDLVPGDIGSRSNLAMALSSLGRLENDLGRHDEAVPPATRATCILEDLAGEQPDRVATYVNLSASQGVLADALIGRGEYDAARDQLERSITGLRDNIRRWPDEREFRNTLAYDLTRLGEAEASLGRFEEARSAYAESLVLINELLGRHPGLPHVLLNMAMAQLRLAETDAALGRDSEAARGFEAAIRTCDTLVERSPDHLGALVNKGLALVTLGDLAGDRGRYEEALRHFDDAVSTLDSGLAIAPGSYYARNNLALALLRSGEKRRELGRLEEAADVLARSAAAFDQAANLSPKSALVLANRVLALLRLGETQFDLGRPELAMESLAAALLSADAALEVAPNLPIALVNRGMTLVMMGSSANDLGRHEQARELFWEAVATNDLALRSAPDMVLAHRNKGSTLQLLGSSLAEAEQFEQADGCFEAARLAFDRVIALTPDHPDGYGCRGNTLLVKGDSLLDRRLDDRARVVLIQALADLDAAVEMAPDSILWNRQRGMVHMLLGHIADQADQVGEACGQYRQAVALFDKILALAPDLTDIREVRKQTLRSWRRLDNGH